MTAALLDCKVETKVLALYCNLLSEDNARVCKLIDDWKSSLNEWLMNPNPEQLSNPSIRFHNPSRLSQSSVCDCLSLFKVDISALGFTDISLIGVNQGDEEEKEKSI